MGKLSIHSPSEGLADSIRLLVLLADTWLHIATKTVTFTQLLETNDPPASHGFGLLEACKIYNNSLAAAWSGDSCTLNPAGTNTFVGTPLTIVALVTSKGEVKDVKSRLSILGLVADRSEAKAARLAARNLDQLFRESIGQKTSRIGIDSAAEGDSGYKTWNEAR